MRWISAILSTQTRSGASTWSPTWHRAPEYVTTDGETAWVTLQENNSIAVIDIRSARVKKVFALGMYRPDAIANFRHEGKAYLITVDEGDPRDCDAFAEEKRVEDLAPDPVQFPNGDGDFDRLFVPRGHSFSIWDTRTGALVFDSGAELEPLLAKLLPGELSTKPEGMALGRVDGCLYAFVSLERIGGTLVLDLSDPKNPEFVDYVAKGDGHPFKSLLPELGDLQGHHPAEQ